MSSEIAGPSEAIASSDNNYRPRRRAQSTISNYLTNSHLKKSVPPASVAVTAQTQSLRAYGSFTPTSSAFPSLKFFADSSLPTSIFPNLTGMPRRRQKPSQLVWRIDYDPISEDSSLASSPVSSIPPSIPSISRRSTSQSSTTFSNLTNIFDDNTPTKPKLNAALAELERNSKFCTRSSQCATCGKPGNDYPRCGRCGEMWCSRPCRLNGGKRHSCTRTVVSIDQ